MHLVDLYKNKNFMIIKNRINKSLLFKKFETVSMHMQHIF